MWLQGKQSTSHFPENKHFPLIPMRLHGFSKRFYESNSMNTIELIRFYFPESIIKPDFLIYSDTLVN